MAQGKGRTVGGMRSGGAAARKPNPEVVSDAKVVSITDRERLPHDEEQESIALDAVLSELGAIEGGKVQVWRVPPDGGRNIYVATMTPEEAQGESSLLESIRQEYGGGDYRIHVRDANGFLANKRVRIAERKKPVEHEGGSVVQAVTALFERQQSQFMATLQALTPQRTEAQSEEAVLNRIKVMAEIVRPASGSGGMKEAMEALRQGIELGKAMQPQSEQGAEHVISSALNAFAPVIADAAAARGRQAIAQRQRPQAVTQAPAAVPVAHQAAASDAQVVATEVPMPKGEGVDDVRQLMDIAVRAAEHGGDPDLYAELILDQAGEDAARQLMGQPADDVIGMLALIDPRVLKHREWFGALHAAVAEQLAESAHESSAVIVDGAAVRPGGPPEDAGSHA
jgi:hypothetical protein